MTVKKHIGIVSCYFMHNYGSVLQAFATQEIMDTMELDNVTVNMSGIFKDIRTRHILYYLRNLTRPQLFISKAGFVRKAVKKRLNAGFRVEMQKRAQAFNRFCTERFRLSAPASGLVELSAELGRYTDVLVGSDQLWLPKHISTGYYTLKFVPDYVNKIAYATSFGVSSLPRYLHTRTKEFLSRIEHISVRERAGQELVRNIAKRDCPVVLDPTLLLSRAQWEQCIPPQMHIGEPYIFCYFLGNNPSHRECARRLARECGKKIVVLRHLDEYIPSDESFGDITCDAGPDDFLNLIRGADYILSDSFHATVLSILHQKNFFVFMRFRKNGIASTNSRIVSILQALGLEERLADGGPLKTNDINYQETELRLENMRASSLEFIRNSLGLTTN